MGHKEVQESCNCAWRHCKHHPDGKICENIARGYECSCDNPEHSDKTMWLGDGTLGEGVRLCAECGSSVADFINEEILMFMQSMADKVPDEMKNLEALLRRHTCSEQFGSKDLVFERVALMEFVFSISYWPDTKITPKDLWRVCEITEKLKSLHLAFQGVDLKKTMLL